MRPDPKLPASHGYVSKLLSIFSSGVNELLRKKFDSIEARLAALEARPELTYEGTHEEGREYRRGMFCTRGGSVWYCRAERTTEKPGASADWALAVKKGADAR